MIFVDSNIPMYLVGASHPRKVDAQRLLEEAVAGGQRLVTSVEVLQEILHRYVAIRRRDAIQPAFEVVKTIVEEVLPVTEADVMRAKDLVLAMPGLSARDALHVAVMERVGATRIMSFDVGFDQIPGLARLGA